MQSGSKKEKSLKPKDNLSQEKIIGLKSRCLSKKAHLIVKYWNYGGFVN